MQYTILVIISGWLLLVGTFACYQFLLAVVAGLSRSYLEKQASNIDDPVSLRVAIVVPAHNEEPSLPETLHSCSKLDYPDEHFQVYVIADNCEDRTAEIAREYGAVCLERENRELKGKGYALAWAFPQVLDEGWDAVAVLDADCRIDSTFLKIAKRYLLKGYTALQARYLVSNIDASYRTYLLAIARILENDWFYRGKAALGLPCTLLGTGMILHRSVLEALPWSEFGICEDTAYSHRLLETGIQTQFMPETYIDSPFPEGASELNVQRSRWIAGNREEKSGWRWMGEGIVHRRWNWVDFGFSQLVLSRPNIMLQLLFTTLLLAVGWALVPGKSMAILSYIFLSILGGYFLYTLVGILSIGLNAKRVKSLILFPVFMLSYLWLAIKTIWSPAPQSWEVTPRKQEDSSSH